MVNLVICSVESRDIQILKVDLIKYVDDICLQVAQSIDALIISGLRPSNDSTTCRDIEVAQLQFV